MSSDSQRTADGSNNETEMEDDVSDHLFCITLIQNQQIGELLLKVFRFMADTVLSSTIHTDPIPYHTSLLTGEMWVQELLNGHPDCIRNELGVQKHIFHKLINELVSHEFSSLRHVTLEEQLAIFLYTCVTGLTCTHVGECFQQSNSTISKYFRLLFNPS